MTDYWRSTNDVHRTRYQPLEPMGRRRGAATAEAAAAAAAATTAVEATSTRAVADKARPVVSVGAFFGTLLWWLLWLGITGCAIAALVVGAVALHRALNLSTTVASNVQCNRTCTYCEANGTSVMPWGGRSEQQFSTNTLGVGPLFAPLNPVNYTGGYNICSTGVGSGGGVGDPADDSTTEHHGSHHHHHHGRDKRFPGYGDDFSWRTQRAPPPGYSIANGDGALPASMEVDGSAFLIGNITSTCGAYVGCETVSPVGNFTILYTYNTSGMVYFQVYPAIEALRVDLVNLAIYVNMLNSTNFTADVVYLTDQVNLLWVAVNNLTDVANNQSVALANISATLVQVINATDTLANYVYNVLAVEVADLAVNISLVADVANAALACCTANNATLAALAANISALQAHMLVVDAEIAVLQGNVTSLQAQITDLQTNMTTLQSEVTILQSNVTTIQNEVTVLQDNVTTLTNATNVLEEQVLNLTACCNSTNRTDLTTGPTIGPTPNGANISGNTLHMAASDSTTRGILYGYTTSGGVNSNAYAGFGTPTSASSGTGNSAVGASALNNCGTCQINVGIGFGSLSQITNGTYNVGVGSQAGFGLQQSTKCIYIGSSTIANGAGPYPNEYMFGNARNTSFTGNGNASYTFDIGSIPTAANPELQISSSGQITQTGSSMIYKNPLPDPSMTYLVESVSQLVPRAFTFKSDQSGRPSLGYYAEEVEAIVDDVGAPVYGALLNYRLVDDTSQPTQSTLVWVIDPDTGLPVQQMQNVYPKKEVVDSVIYQGFVVALVAHCRWLAARCNQLEQFMNLTTPVAA